MKEKKIEIGNVVKLKSSSAVLMTVNDYYDNDIVECVWFDGKEKKSGEFNINALTIHSGNRSLGLI